MHICTVFIACFSRLVLRYIYDRLDGDFGLEEEGFGEAIVICGINTHSGVLSDKYSTIAINFFLRYDISQRRVGTR
jgi:hypothetical protein